MGNACLLAGEVVMISSVMGSGEIGMRGKHDYCIRSRNIAYYLTQQRWSRVE